MKISEIFYSIQGEGISTGEPAIFLRLGGCNLKCKFCDTPHGKTGENFTVEEVFKEIEHICSTVRYPLRKLVVTGGEPLLQIEELNKLFKKLNEMGTKPIEKIQEVVTIFKIGSKKRPATRVAIEKFVGLLKENPTVIIWNHDIEHVVCKQMLWDIEIETNGTVITNEDFDKYVSQYNISPKLANSGNQKNKRIILTSLGWFVNDCKSKTYFKFVVEDTEDLEEIIELTNTYEIPREKVLLMPLGKTAEELNKRKKWLVELCKKYGYIFCNRLHVDIWGDKIGV
jgi:7-carboxy-7-deazaguanine synthase